MNGRTCGSIKTKAIRRINLSQLVVAAGRVLHQNLLYTSNFGTCSSPEFLSLGHSHKSVPTGPSPARKESVSWSQLSYLGRRFSHKRGLLISAFSRKSHFCHQNFFTKYFSCHSGTENYYCRSKTESFLQIRILHM